MGNKVDAVIDMSNMTSNYSHLSKIISMYQTIRNMDNIILYNNLKCILFILQNIRKEVFFCKNC